MRISRYKQILNKFRIDISETFYSLERQKFAQPSCEVNKSKNHKEILDGALPYMRWLIEMIKGYNLKTQKCPFSSMHFEMAQLIHK